MKRFCHKCGGIIPAAEYRAHAAAHKREYDRERDRHRPSWSPGRNRSAQRRFRREVLENAGHQCQALEGEIRCPVKEPLFAHHLVKGSYEASDGIAVCRHHHRHLDRYAR